jgi:hypothetical protein
VVPGGVLGVLAEGRRYRDTERLFKNRDVDAQVPKGLVQVGVEPCNRQAAREREGLDPPFSALHDESVVDEVERDLELGFPVVKATRGEAADVDVERRVPPVVARRRRGEPDLAEDLTVEVEGVLRRSPVREVELRESHQRSSTNATSST